MKMNNRLSRFLSVASLAFVVFFTSCKKNNFSVDVDPLQTPSRAQFVPANGINRVSYFVLSSGAPYKIPVGMTDVATVDRTINLTYSSRTAVAGQQFNAPATMTIKAGQAVDSLNFVGLFAGYATPGRFDTVKVKFSGIGGVVLKDSFELIMRKYCDVVLTNLAGNYPNTREFSSAGALSWGPYLTVLKNVVSTGATTATAQIENMYDDGWGDINCTLSWASPTSFTVAIPLQATGSPNRSVRTSTAAGAVSTFSSCDNTLTLDIDLVNTTTGAVTTSRYRIVMAR
jgi:hypothetical protein